MLDQNVLLFLAYFMSGCTNKPERRYQFSLEAVGNFVKNPIKVVFFNASTFLTSAKKTLEEVKAVYVDHHTDCYWKLAEILNSIASYMKARSIQLLQMLFSLTRLQICSQRDGQRAWNPCYEARHSWINQNMQKSSWILNLYKWRSWWLERMRSDSRHYTKAYETICERQHWSRRHHSSSRIGSKASSKETSFGAKK